MLTTNIVLITNFINIHNIYVMKIFNCEILFKYRHLFIRKTFNYYYSGGRAIAFFKLVFNKSNLQVYRNAGCLSYDKVTYVDSNLDNKYTCL